MSERGDSPGESTETVAETDAAPRSTGDVADAASDAVTSRLGAYLIDFGLLSVASVAIFFVVFIVGVIIGAAAIGATTSDPS
jgi:hypothetical protein